MTKVFMFTNVRCDSERVPNKSLLDLGGKAMFAQVLERGLQGYPNPDYLGVVTPQQMVNDGIELLARQYGYDVVRSPREQSTEQLNAFDHYGLKDDDIYLQLGGDSPLQYTKHLTFAAEKLLEHDADVAIAVKRRGSLGWAIHIPAACRVAHYRRIVPLAKFWEQGTTYGDPKDHGKYVLIEMPSHLHQPWPWGPLQVDWPLQAVAMRAIFVELYEGKPIDERDVVELYSQNPMLASLVPVDTPTAGQATHPYGAADLLVQTVRNIGNYVEVKFEEGGEETDK